MTIKINKVASAVRSGIPAASVATSAAVLDNGVAQVHVHVAAVDCFGVSHVIAGLRLSVEEARALGAKLLSTAHDATELAAR